MHHIYMLDIPGMVQGQFSILPKQSTSWKRADMQAVQCQTPTNQFLVVFDTELLKMALILECYESGWSPNGGMEIVI